ncbi:MAG: NADH-quinone oxidoreductase subunit C [Elusimicrobiota bacterium]|jgi:NADH:ubiquinone oxidoreductase subunit C
MTREEIQAKVAARFPKTDRDSAEVKDYLTLRLPDAASLPAVVDYFKDELGFSYLDMATAVDWKGPVDPAGFIREPNPNPFVPQAPAAPAAAKPLPGTPYRDAFCLVYALSHLEARVKVFLKLDVPRSDARVPSLTRRYRSAEWQEREVFDLFGVQFEGHPDLRKILTASFLQGHPLRKDYAHVPDRFDK